MTDAPPANWDRARRIDYLDWTEKVVAGCRGTNAPLEKLYDECSNGDGRSSEADTTTAG